MIQYLELKESHDLCLDILRVVTLSQSNYLRMQTRPRGSCWVGLYFHRVVFPERLAWFSWWPWGKLWSVLADKVGGWSFIFHIFVDSPSVEGFSPGIVHVDKIKTLFLCEYQADLWRLLHACIVRGAGVGASSPGQSSKEWRQILGVRGAKIVRMGAKSLVKTFLLLFFIVSPRGAQCGHWGAQF